MPSLIRPLNGRHARRGSPPPPNADTTSHDGDAVACFDHRTVNTRTAEARPPPNADTTSHDGDAVACFDH
jgi:hypothetical protein